MKLARIFFPLALMGTVGCDTESATTVVVDNDYAAIRDGGDMATEMTVFKVWWVTSLLSDAVSPQREGQSERTVPNADFAYAVLAPGWDPSSPAPPTKLIAAKSATKLTVTRGDTLHVRVSDATFVGNCGAGKPLSQDEATFVAQNIFPAEFAGATYDAATCTATALATDASADAMGDAPQADAIRASDATFDGPDAGSE